MAHTNQGLNNLIHFCFLFFGLPLEHGESHLGTFLCFAICRIPVGLGLVFRIQQDVELMLQVDIFGLFKQFNSRIAVVDGR